MHNREFRMEASLYKAVTSFIDKYADNMQINKTKRMMAAWINLGICSSECNMALWLHFIILL